MLPTLLSLAPRQKSLIRTVRLDVNHIVRDADLFDNLNESNLDSLQGLRKVELFFYTFDFVFPSLNSTPIPYPRIQLVDSILKLSAPQPSFAVVSIQHSRVYNTQSTREWMSSSEIEQCVKDIQESFSHEAAASEQRAKQTAVNDDWVESYRREDE